MIELTVTRKELRTRYQSADTQQAIDNLTVIIDNLKTPLGIYPAKAETLELLDANICDTIRMVIV